MTKFTFTALVSIVTLSAALASIDARAEGVRFHRQNAAGGVTAGAAQRHTGANGGSEAHGRIRKTDGDGNGESARGTRIEGPNGGSAERGAKNTWSADGSATHESHFSASGAKGDIDSQGSATRAADGSVTQSRTTTATGANGGTYTGSTNYSKDTGVVHTGTCTDAGGQVVPCPR